MYKATHISPMIPSFNIKETVAFFIDVLSFNTVMDVEGYAILEKNNLTVHILPAADIGEMEFYLEIDNIDALWDTIKNKLTGVKICEPFDREYGMREIHIIIPQTKTLLFIGSPVA